ncbi:MAG: hypothetical protein NTW52_17085 [Planctomycetota bacterium]|nr:hypothetical protein [Planctomycetota bacterium]
MNHSSLNRRQVIQSIVASLPIAVATKVLASDKTDATLPPVRAITRGPKFHWRGYYDKFLFDPTNRFVLANEVDFEGRSPTAEDSIRIGIIDTQDGDRWGELGSTFAWNWQQGCMLQWVPGTSDDIAWNDRVDGQFVSHILNVKSGSKRTLPHPFYCISPDGKTGFAPDFRRLNDTRPGYGYSGVPDPNQKVLAPDDAGIWRMDMQSGEQKLIFSFADALKIPFEGREDAVFRPHSKHWFNHLLCNPDGTRLFFLHRWRNSDNTKEKFFTRAMTMNFDGTDLYVIDPWGDTSHFIWRDPKHIFAWAWHPSHQQRFYLYEDKTENVSVVGPNTMTMNGHNTYVPGTDSNWVLNDTYPDAKTLQNPYLYHIPTDRRVPLGHFPSPPSYRGEWRCDTHPTASRNGKQVIFDSPHQNGRQVYLADISQIVG